LSLNRATVIDDVLKLGYTSVIFLDLGAKVDETWAMGDDKLDYLVLISPKVRQISSKF